MTRVLVVGAGHNGLVAAIHLAAGGFEVTVLGHAPRPGGAAAAAEVKLPGFVHDHCAGFAPMSAASPAMRELELDVDWIAPPTAMATPFPRATATAPDRDGAPVPRRQRDRPTPRRTGHGRVARRGRRRLGAGDGPAAAACPDPR